jgi:hypothetical protein
VSKLIELIAQYGVQCSETKELAPTREFAAEYTRCATLESELAQLRAEVESAKDRAVKYQVERNTLVVENSNLRAEVEGMRENDARYRSVLDSCYSTDETVGPCRELVAVHFIAPLDTSDCKSTADVFTKAVDTARKEADRG